MKNKIALLLVLLFGIHFTACDPERSRECGSFTYELNTWSIMDDTIASEIIFVDTSFKEYVFAYEDLELSKPYRGFALTSSVEAVPCELSKRISYFCEALDLYFIFSYDQIDVPENRPANNECFFSIEARRKASQTVFKTQKLDIFHLDISKMYYLAPLDSIALADESYYDVWKWNISQVTNLATGDEVDPIYFSDVIFQIPNGIVGLILKDGEQLILKKE